RRLCELDAVHLLKTRHEARDGYSRALADTLAHHFRLQGATWDEVAAIIGASLRGEHGPMGGDSALLARLARPTHDERVTANPAVNLVRQRPRYLVVRRFLRCLSRSKPVLALLDDAHWGADGLRFCRFLLDGHSRRAEPLLIVAAVDERALARRPVEGRLLADLTRRESVSQIKIGPLTDADQSRLLRSLLPLEERLLARLVACTAGNPGLATDSVASLLTEDPTRVSPRSQPLSGTPGRPPGRLGR
ncbi:MAG: hypothetical protein ACOCV2_07590, partial [Persicimonas sp.]